MLLDELSGAVLADRPRRPRADLGLARLPRRLAAAQPRHQGTDDPFPDALGWFSREDRPTNEIKQIDRDEREHRLLHHARFTSPTAPRTPPSSPPSATPFTQNAGIEDLTVIGGDQGNIRFHWAANSWAKRIENTVWHDEGFALDDSFRVEIRDSYVHDAAWAQPGGAGYAISLSDGSLRGRWWRTPSS